MQYTYNSNMSADCRCRTFDAVSSMQFGECRKPYGHHCRIIRSIPRDHQLVIVKKGGKFGFARIECSRLLIVIKPRTSRALSRTLLSFCSWRTCSAVLQRPNLSSEPGPADARVRVIAWGWNCRRFPVGATFVDGAESPSTFEGGAKSPWAFVAELGSFTGHAAASSSESLIWLDAQVSGRGRSNWLAGVWLSSTADSSYPDSLPRDRLSLRGLLRCPRRWARGHSFLG